MVKVTMKVEQKTDGTYKAHGIFPSLKGVCRGSGKTREEAIEFMKADIQDCFIVPIDFNIKEIPMEARW